MRAKLLRLIVFLLLPAFAAAQLPLLDVHLPAGVVQGFNVEEPQNTGKRTRYFLDADGDGVNEYSGFRFFGEGRDATHVVPPEVWDPNFDSDGDGPGDGDLDGVPEGRFVSVDDTISVGVHAGRVEFYSLTIHGGARKALHQGEENRPLRGLPFIATTLVFYDVHVQADVPGSAPWVHAQSGAGNTSVWGLMTYSAAIFMSRCTLDWTRGAEHAIYAHGLAMPGIMIDQCDFLGSGGECVKDATRPGESPWTPSTILITNSTFRNWGPQPWSWRGGGGIVLQGTGSNVFVIACTFYGGPGHAKSRAIMIDDGGVGRFYNSITGEPGTGPANGWVYLADNVLVGDGQPSWALLARVGTLSPGAGIDVARGYVVINCAGFSTSETSKFEVGKVLGDSVLFQDCNTAEARAYVEAALPGAQLAEAMATGSFGSFPLSRGYRSGIFTQPPFIGVEQPAALILPR